MASQKPLYGYFSEYHKAEGGPVSVFRTPHKEQEEVTGFGSTENPEENGYHFLQTRLVGEITSDWRLIHQYTVRGPIDPEFLEDPEEDRKEEYLAA